MFTIDEINTSELKKSDLKIEIEYEEMRICEEVTENKSLEKGDMKIIIYPNLNWVDLYKREEWGWTPLKGEEKLAILKVII